MKPDLLVWARESAGLAPETAAKKVQVKPAKLESWERGEDRPTVKQLRNLARVYKRPLAVFYLPEPPHDFQVMHDFRRLPGRVAGIRSPALRYEIRRAYDRREIVLELMEESEEVSGRFVLRARITDDPEDVARSIRQTLRVTVEEQASWQPGYETFNRWRTVFENLGILVFQITGVESSEARGFSIAESPFPVIATNVKELPVTRTFTMFHELSHIMLREGGLCDLDEFEVRRPEDQQVEVFCNRVAGAAIVPARQFLQEGLLQRRRGSRRWEEDEIQYLARRYGVSRETIVRRLLILGRTSEAFYQQKRDQYTREFEARSERAAPGFAPPHAVAIATGGPFFVRLVLDNYHQEKITASDVADFLGIRLKHLDAIEGELSRARPREPVR